MAKLATELAGITGWINSPPLRLADLRGRVVFLDFWTFGCGNCQRTLPHMRELQEKYADRGLTIIGVHTPEFAQEKDPAKVRAAVEKAGLKYAIALDTENTSWWLYGGEYWPRQTLIDAKGNVRYEHIGEGGYGEIESKVKELLAERKP